MMLSQSYAVTFLIGIFSASKTLNPDSPKNVGTISYDPHINLTISSPESLRNLGTLSTRSHRNLDTFVADKDTLLQLQFKVWKLKFIR